MREETNNVNCKCSSVRSDNTSNTFDICHYTNIKGLTGIIRDNGEVHFWFTRYDCLNDTSEGQYVIDLFKQVCDNLYKPL